MLAATHRPHPLRRACALLGVIGGLLIAPLSAQASTETLARSTSNIIFAPFDIVLSPVTAALGQIGKLRDVEDTPGVQIAYAFPGYFFYTGVVMGGGLIRGVTGLIQFIPGVVLLPFETDLDPLMDPVDDATALFEYDFEYYPIRFGLDYTSKDF